jgi:hypothetical protein
MVYNVTDSNHGPNDRVHWAATNDAQLSNRSAPSYTRLSANTAWNALNVGVPSAKSSTANMMRSNAPTNRASEFSASANHWAMSDGLLPKTPQPQAPSTIELWPR